MKIFSHRGLGFGKEENSIESYKESLKQGFSLEIDVQKSRDDVLVISHDTNLKRQRGLDKNLTDMYSKELKELKIPSFEEVLEYFKKKDDKQLLAIHIKDEYQIKILDLITKMITHNKLEKNCFLFDISTIGANHIKQLNSKLEMGLSVGEKRYTGSIYLWEDIKDCLDMDIVWWDEWHSKLYNKENRKLIKEKTIYAISPELHKIHNHPKGNSLEDIKEVWKDLIDLEVDGICTDYPEELKKYLRLMKRK